MYKIYSDYDSFYYDRYKHGSIGNKILHMYFMINLAKKHHRLPAFYDGININSIFDYSCDFSPRPEKINKFYYIEEEPYFLQNKFLKFFNAKNIFKNRNINVVVENAKKFCFNNLNFLEQRLLPDQDIMIKGWFFDYMLMPSFEDVQSFVKPKKILVKNVLTNLPGITEEHSVAVHFRGSDFTNHLNWVFKKGIKLTRNYYQSSIIEAKKQLGDNLTFYLFSDEPETLCSFFEGEKIVVHSGPPSEAWVAMFLAKNIIQSNSSFCWSASLYNKDFSLQPRGGYNLYYPELGNVPYSFAHPNSVLVPAIDK
jgi:hypothetical protein